MLQNPVYCGKIKLPAFNGNKSYIVQAKHQGLISPELFDSVQLILKKRSRNAYVKVSINDMLPLKGILYCPRCLKRLTGSGSLGNKKRYYYYHCNSSCGYRIRADKVDSFISENLDKLRIHTPYEKLFNSILMKEYNATLNSNRINQTYITNTIETLISRTIKAKSSLQQGHLDTEDYLVIEADCKSRIHTLGHELHEAYSLETFKSNYLLNTIAAPLNKLYQQIINDKHTFLTIILQPKLILDTSNFYHNLSNVAKTVFRINSLNKNTLYTSGLNEAFNINSQTEIIDTDDKEIHLFFKKIASFLINVT